MNPSISLSHRFNRPTFSLWMVLNMVSFIVAGDLHYQESGLLVFNFRDIDPFAAVVGFVFGAVSGLIIGSLQWFVLRRWFPQARLWIPLNMLGFGLVHALNDALPNYKLLPLPLLWLLGGFVIGLCQYLALRHSLIKAGYWIFIAAVTWLLSYQIGNAMVNTLYYYKLANPLLERVVDGTAIGLVTSFITAPWLRWFGTVNTAELY